MKRVEAEIYVNLVDRELRNCPSICQAQVLGLSCL